MGATPELNSVGEALHGGGGPYEIRDGRLITQIGGTPFAMTVYQLGDRYLASRDDEFGYANYEVEAAGN